MIGPSALSSDYTLTLPTALGSNGQVLSTNGVGVLSWESKVGTTGDESIAGHKTFTGDSTTFTSANATDPLITIKNTTDDTNGARLRFVKDKGSAGAGNDENGKIQFYGDDAAQDQVMFSEIKSQVSDATNGEEGGKFTISVASHDGSPTPGLVIEDGDAAGELDVTIGAGSSSNTIVVGNTILAGTLTVANAVSLGTATSIKGLSIKYEITWRRACRTSRDI